MCMGIYDSLGSVSAISNMLVSENDESFDRHRYQYRVYKHQESKYERKLSNRTKKWNSSLMINGLIPERITCSYGGDFAGTSTKSA